MKELVTLWASTVLIALLMCMTFYFGFYVCKQSRIDGKFIDTVRSTIYDTIYYRMPIAHDSVVIRYLNKYVTVSKMVKDSIVVHKDDSIPVTIPITQKEYNDSTYRAWVSGYNANLDSINIFNKTVTNTIYKQVVIKEPSNWGVGIQAGYGYSKQGFSPYVGVGVQYNIVSW
jgi:hypothetical protein